MRPRFSWRFALAAIALVALGVGAFALRHPAPVEPAPPEAPEPAAPSGPVRAAIGRSVQGREIESYTFGSGPTRVLFVGGIHGGYEWNSVVLAYSAMDYLQQNPDVVPEGLSVTIIPSLNPDGVFSVIGREGRFAASDVPPDVDQSIGRFNGNNIDLNRNFDCRWQPESTWRSKAVSAGSAPFSEPEAAALRDFVATANPEAVVFWHSQANAVYASACDAGVLPETRALMSTYASAAGYPAIETFDAYPVTGAAEDWLASIGVPAITVELASHEAMEWEKNVLGILATLNRYAAPSR